MNCGAKALEGDRTVTCLLPSGHAGSHWSPISVRDGTIARWTEGEQQAGVTSGRDDPDGGDTGVPRRA